MIVKKGYDFDDLLLLPNLSVVESRKDVDLSVCLGTLNLKIPIIGSPMKNIMGYRLVKALGELGGIGILHRFYPSEQQRFTEIEFLHKYGVPFGVAVGLGDPALDRIISFNPNIICIDVANGYLTNVAKYTKIVAEKIRDSDIMLMVGNVVTLVGANALSYAGADMIRVGIGSGGLCTTRNVTGIGCPQLTAISDCTDNLNSYIVSDGGIRGSADIVKALAAGADAVMIGSKFGSVYEAEHSDDVIYGMASKKIQSEYYLDTKSVEGLEISVKKEISVYEYIDQLMQGVRSACTYLGAVAVSDLSSMKLEWVTVGKNTLKDV